MPFRYWWASYKHMIYPPRWPLERSREEENAWREWIQHNLNAGGQEPGIGQYSIECVVGWSKSGVVWCAVLPFILAITGTLIFGNVWSCDWGSHNGNPSAAFTISSYFAGLAAAVVALIAFFGELPSK